MATRNIHTDWKQYYKDHLITIDEAVEKLRDDDVVFLGQASMVPLDFLDRVSANKERFNGLTFFYNIFNGPTDIVFDPETKDHFHLYTLFAFPIERMGFEEGNIAAVGCSYDQYEYGLWENGVNASALTYCPPDEDGWMNCGCYGMCTNNTTALDPRIKKKFAFVNRTGVYPAPGDAAETNVHVTDFDYIIELDTEMMALPEPPPAPVDEKIASFIMPYIKPGDNVQIGYGGVSQTILGNLDKIDGTFKIFSEVLCDSMIPFVKSGKITSLYAASPGTCEEETFRFLATTDLNVRLLPRTFCIEPLAIMSLETLVAINTTLMCDLLGQCCSEAQGLKPYTGMGGSFAYIYGAQRCPGGRSFICLRSTFIDRDGVTQTKVVPWLPEGVIVSMLKNYVMFLVSEWGVADVYLKSYPERIRQILKIAHPDFREELKAKILTTPLCSERDFDGYDMFDGKLPEPRQPATCVPFIKYDIPVRSDMLPRE